jgi:mono/diheme cytochrome c family protein
MIVAVTHGRPGTPMPGFESQLSPAQIEAIVDYVRTRFMPSQSTNVHAGIPAEAGWEYHERPLPGELHGEFERGRSLYFMNCVECHGVSGDGDGPRAYFIFPKPRSFLDPATQRILNRPRLFSGISDGVIGKEMPAWNKVLENQDIADIAEFVYREFIQSGSTAGSADD